MPVPEGFYVHDVLNAVATAEIAAKQGSEHVAVSKYFGVGAAPSEMRIDSFTKPGSRKTTEN